MEMQIAGTNLEISESEQGYIESKINKLTKHLPDIIDIKVEVAHEKTKSPDETIVVRVKVESGVSETPFYGEERGKNVKMAVDKVADVMIRQLENFKGRLYDKGRGNPQARGKYPDLSEPAGEVRKLVKTKKFNIEPLTTELAVEEMENLGHSFFLFLDNDSEEIRLLYRRKDGNYGLIEPQIG